MSEIKHAKWIPVIGFTGVEYMGCKETTVDGYRCSNCDGGIDFTKKHYKYCPYCGAKMDGEYNEK